VVHCLIAVYGLGWRVKCLRCRVTRHLGL